MLHILFCYNVAYTEAIGASKLKLLHAWFCLSLLHRQCTSVTLLDLIRVYYVHVCMKVYTLKLNHKCFSKCNYIFNRYYMHTCWTVQLEIPDVIWYQHTDNLLSIDVILNFIIIHSSPISITVVMSVLQLII